MYIRDCGWDFRVVDIENPATKPKKKSCSNNNKLKKKGRIQTKPSKHKSYIPNIIYFAYHAHHCHASSNHKLCISSNKDHKSFQNVCVCVRWQWCIYLYVYQIVSVFWLSLCFLCENISKRKIYVQRFPLPTSHTQYKKANVCYTPKTCTPLIHSSTPENVTVAMVVLCVSHLHTMFVVYTYYIVLPTAFNSLTNETHSFIILTLNIFFF